MYISCSLLGILTTLPLENRQGVVLGLDIVRPDTADTNKDKALSNGEGTREEDGVVPQSLSEKISTRLALAIKLITSVLYISARL